MAIMIREPMTYIDRQSPVHRMDARVKIILLFVYSFSLFLCDTWVGLACFAALFAVAFKASRLPLKPLLRVLLPLYVILAFTWAFNAFTFDASARMNTFGYGVSPGIAGIWAGAPAMELLGPMYLLPAGALVGVFVVARILLLTLASFIVAYSTPSARLADAAGRLIDPLRRIGVPVDDVALVLSLALRFIPILIRETYAMRTAHRARGARFDEGGFWAHLKAWGAVFIPLMVALFRKAQRLGTALDARCYGAATRRTVLHPFCMGRMDRTALVVGCALCVAVAALW